MQTVACADHVYTGRRIRSRPQVRPKIAGNARVLRDRLAERRKDFVESTSVKLWLVIEVLDELAVSVASAQDAQRKAFEAFWLKK